MVFAVQVPRRLGAGPARDVCASRGSDASPLLLKAAKRLEPIDVGLARATYLDALVAADFASRLASPGGSLPEVACAAAAAPPPPHPPRAPDLLLDGLAAAFGQGYAAGVPILRRALQAFGSDMPADPELRWLSMAAALPSTSGMTRALTCSPTGTSSAPARPARSASFCWLSLHAYTRSSSPGELTAAASAAQEMRAVLEATGTNLAPYGVLGWLRSAAAKPRHPR